MSKLADKARKINFDEDEQPPARPQATDLRPPRTGVGAINASLAMGRAVVQENESLKQRLAKFEDAQVIEFLDPKVIAPSRFGNRHALSFAGPAFLQLKDEIGSTGRNVQPIKVRRLAEAKGEIEFEIVFGHRRWRACSELGLKVAAIVADLSDAELFVEMDRENRARADLTPWEQGVMYKRALDEQLYPSLRQLAQAVGASPGPVSQAIQLASLPPPVVEAFANPLELQHRWAAPLKAAYDRDPEAVQKVSCELALASPRLSGRDVFVRLTGAVQTAARGSSTEFRMGKKSVGSWSKDPSGAVIIKIKAGALPSSKEQQLQEYLSSLFR